MYTLAAGFRGCSGFWRLALKNGRIGGDKDAKGTTGGEFGKDTYILDLNMGMRWFCEIDMIECLAGRR